MSLYDLACIAKVFDSTACSIIYLTLLQYQYKMTQHNTLNIKLSNLQLNKLKSGIKNGIEVTLKLSSNVVGDEFDDDELLLWYG